MCDFLCRGKRLDGIWQTGYYFAKPILSRAFLLSGGEQWEIDPSTAGRYTGLTDKNGVRIFEGDIIQRTWLGRLRIYQVYYDRGTVAFIGKCVNGGGFTTFYSDGDMFEVIGNIHDNPDLIER